MSLKPKVAHVVSDQIPDVFVDSYLHKFLIAYYQFMEQSGVAGALDYMRNALEYKDIDTAPDYIVKEVVYTLLNNYKQLNVEPRLLVKNLKEIFSNKGNERSYKFLMQALFGEEAALAWGRDQVFKASAFKYDQDVVMLLDVPDIDVPYPNNWNLDGNVIFKEKTATTSHATAVVDSTTVITQNGKQYFRLTIVPHTVHGNFYPDDYITCECRNNGKFATYIKGQHGNLEIINSGTLYKTGDLLRFVGAEGAGYITEVTGGPVEQVSIINPGLGYSVDDTIVVEHELGNGFAAKIDAVDGVDAQATPNMKLEEIYINDGGFGYQVGDVVTVDCGVPFTTTVSSVSPVSPFAEYVNISETGSDYLFGYRLGAYTLDGAGVVNSYTELKADNIASGEVKLNQLYNIDATSQLAINGLFAEAWVSSVTSGAATINFKAGINYVSPAVYVSRYDAAYLDCSVSLDGVTHGISSVTVNSSRNFTSVSDSVDIVSGNKFITTTHPEKYDIGYGIKIGSFNARVTGISGNIVSLNIACTSTEISISCSIFPHPLTVTDKGSGATGSILFYSGSIQSLTIPNFVTNKIENCIVTGGSGQGLNVSPYFNVDSITVDNPGSQYAESILRYDVISVTTGNTSFLTTRSEKYEVGAKISFGYHVTTVTEVYGNQISFADAAPVDYVGTVSIRVFKPAIDVIISDGHGSGAELAFVVQNGVIARIDNAFISGGSGYTYAKITDAPTNVGSGAKIEAVISSGTIILCNVVDGGHDYTTGDYFIVNGDGSSATIPSASVVTADQAIRKVYVKNSGSGYYPECKISAVPSGFSVGTPAVFDVVIDNGSITAVNVIDQGAGYDVDNLSFVFAGDGYDAEVSSFTISSGKITAITIAAPTGFGYTTATLKAVRGNIAELTPVVKNGQIVSVEVGACGSGYSQAPEYHILPDTNWMPPEPGIMEYTFPMMDFYRLFPEPIGYSRIATASAEVSLGAIKSVDVTYPGEGYYHLEKPMSLTVVGKGTGAVLWPIVDIWATDANGLPIRKLKDIKVLDQGQGYDDSTKIIVNRGGCPAGDDAQLSPVIVNGKIVAVHIDAFGTNYYTGTKVYIKGNGQDATVKAKINSGIREVQSSGFSYTGSKPVPVIHDAYGSGADIVANWNGDTLVGFTVNAPGSGYTSPVITIGSGPTAGVFQCKTFGTIDAIDIVNPGFDYTNADCVILCDSGFSATTNVTFSTLREISSVTVHNHGFRYGKVPKVSIVDKSGSGRISKVKILDKGAGYKRLPKITVPSDNATEQALLVAYGSNIGGVAKVQLTDFGVDIDSDTIVTGSINVINKEINRYVQGEPVINRDLFYSESDYSDGPTGTLSEIDNATAYIKIKLPPVKVSLETEDGYVLFGDDGELMIEGAEDFGKNWKSAYSQVSLDPMIVDRFEGRFHPTALAYHAPKLSNSNSILNTNIRLTNSRNIQDFAYTVKTGVDIKFWRDIVKQMIHPSGYGLYGQIVDQNFIKRSVKSIAKTESGIIQDVIWLFINLSDDDSIAHVPVRSLYEHFIVEWNKLIQLLMKSESYTSIVHSSMNDLTLAYVSKFGIIEWNNNVSERNHKFGSLTANGFKSWYPYEGLDTFTNSDGYVVPMTYWTSANTGIQQFKDMSIQDYISNNKITNMQQDSFILIKQTA